MTHTIGTPCKKCGSRYRYLADRKCVACHRIAERKRASAKAKHIAAQQGRLPKPTVDPNEVLSGVNYETAYSPTEGDKP